MRCAAQIQNALAVKCGEVRKRCCCKLLKGVAPQVGLEPTTLRLTEAAPEIYHVRPMTMKRMTVNDLRPVDRTPIDAHRSP